MGLQKQKRIWQPSRQVVRAETRRRIWDHLKGTDFEGERVAIRDGSGKPVIHRAARSVLKDMLRGQYRKRCSELRQDIIAAMAK